MEKLTVFLGGTCGTSTWRDKLIPKLSKNIKAFNPIVPDWTPECQAIEDKHKAKDDINLFVITPESGSTYSFSEIGMAAKGEPNRTVVCFLDNENGTQFEGQQAKASKKLAKDLTNLGLNVFYDLDSLAGFLNEKYKEKEIYYQKNLVKAYEKAAKYLKYEDMKIIDKTLARKDEIKELRGMDEAEARNSLNYLFFRANNLVEADYDPRLGFSQDDLIKPMFHKYELDLLTERYGKDSYYDKLFRKCEIEEELEAPCEPVVENTLNNQVQQDKEL